MPHYRKHGKIETPLTDEQFEEGMRNGHFAKQKHKGFVALLHYSAVRKTEALRARKEQFSLVGLEIKFDVGKRLKRGLKTPPLTIPLEAPYATDIWEAVRNTKDGNRVFPYSPKTGYNIVARVFKYPHYHRLSRITWFFEQGFPISQVRSWTGLSLSALNYYVGLVDVAKMGRALKPKEKERLK